jgi:hypothetical protein
MCGQSPEVKMILMIPTELQESFSEVCNASSLLNISHPTMVPDLLESSIARISSLKYIFRSSELVLLMSFDPIWTTTASASVLEGSEAAL